MVTVIVEATVKDNDAFDSLMRNILPDTRAYEGCEGITVQRNLDESSQIVLIEHWESRPHYDKYLAWRQETGVLDQIVALLEGPPVIRCYADVGV